jgi:hypothetical protein
VNGRPDLRIAAAEIEDRLAVARRSLRDAGQEIREVLRREPLEASRRLPHRLTLS